LDQVGYTLVRFFVEYVESGSVMPFSNDFIDGVHVTDQVVGGPDHGREGRSGAGDHGAVLHWQL